MPETIKLLENFASYCAERNKVIAQNIANIGTENYRRQDVIFKDLLDQNMNANLKTSGSSQLSGVNNDDSPSYEIVTDNSQDNVSGVNNVDIDKEMSNLAQNQLNFSFAAQRIGDYYKDLDKVINGGSSL